MNETDICEEAACCQLCEKEQQVEGKTITVYSARTNPIYGGLPQRHRGKKGQQIKEESKPKRFYSQIEMAEVDLGANCQKKRWEGLIPWAAGLAVLDLFLTFLTRPISPAAFVMIYAFFLVIMWGFLAFIYDPDEYIVQQLNAQRTELERYKVYFTRRVYKKLMLKSIAQKKSEYSIRKLKRPHQKL